MSSLQQRPAGRGASLLRGERRDPGAALTRYRVLAITTGVMLLALTVVFVLQLCGIGPGRLGVGIYTAHGWIYLVYLVTVFDLWSKLRWPFGRFVVLVLAGVVPLLSFFAEHRVVAEVRAGRSGPSVPAVLPGAGRHQR